MRTTKSRQFLRLGLFPVIGCVAVISLTFPSTMVASAASPQVTKIKVGSGTTTGSTGLDPNTSFCAFPSNGSGKGFKSVKVDSYYPSPTCATGFPSNPYVISAAQASSNGWGAPLAGTNWVGPNSTGASNAPDAGGFVYPPATSAPSCPAGNTPSGFQTCNFYIYDATFTLQCKKAKMTGTMKADNLAGVFVNGHFVKEQATGAGFSYDGVNAPAANFGAGTAFGPVPIADFVVGVNTVDFVVWDSTVPATGIDFKFVVKESCPGK
jgi:hypothetical protein